jgi:hypothetical protein
MQLLMFEEMACTVEHASYVYKRDANSQQKIESSSNATTEKNSLVSGGKQ